jgi:hypothetical protein
LHRTRFCYANFICAHLPRGDGDDNWSETFSTRSGRGRFRKVGMSFNDWPAGLEAFGRDGCGADDLAGRRRPREIHPDPRRFALRQSCLPTFALLTGRLSLPKPFPNTQGSGAPQAIADASSRILSKEGLYHRLAKIFFPG